MSQRVLNDFELQFIENLNQEWSFYKEISSGRQDALRTDRIEQHIEDLCGVANVLGQGAKAIGIPLVKEFVSFITNQIEKEQQLECNEFVEYKKSILRKYEEEKLKLLFQQVAREVKYQYGACILHFVESLRGHSLDRLARIGATRVIYYAIFCSIDFENCEKLVRGLAEGFAELHGGDLFSKLCVGLIHQSPLSCEGLYTRSGFMSPSGKFWIHADYDRQLSKDGQKKFVEFVQPCTSFNFGRENLLVPKYGYIAVPSDESIEALGFRKHNPHIEANAALNRSIGLEYRYVGLVHLVHYLTDVKGSIGRDGRLGFNRWLLTNPQHSREYSVLPGHSICAVYRGDVNAEVLLRRGVNFGDGAFEQVDFSYCRFSNVNLNNMKDSKLVSCSFINCRATGSALTGANLSLSSFDSCKFEGLRSSFISLDYANLSNTSFANSKLDGLSRKG